MLSGPDFSPGSGFAAKQSRDLSTRTARFSTSGHQESQAGKKDDAASSIPWTALRCQKLLQKLELRLDALQKLLSSTSSHSMDRPTRKRSCLGEDVSKERKRPRLTYGLRSRKPLITGLLKDTSGLSRSALCDNGYQHHKEPPSISVKGIIRGARVTKDSSASQDIGQIDEWILAKELDGSRHNSTDGRYRIHRGIFDCTAALLRITRPRSNDVHNKSLLGMCLRRVPACLEELEAWDRPKPSPRTAGSLQLSSKISWEVYSQLEAFGSYYSGWRPLSQTVRSHGLFLLNKATAGGLFDPNFVQVLVRLCRHYGCDEEAALLVQALPGALPPPRDPMSKFEEHSRLRPLQALLSPIIPGKQSRRHEAISNCVLTLLQKRRLPASWIATRAFLDFLRSAMVVFREGVCISWTTELLVEVLKILSTRGNSRALRPNDDSFNHEDLVLAATDSSAKTIDASRISHRKVPNESQTIRRRILYIFNKSTDQLGVRPMDGWSEGVLMLLIMRSLGDTGFQDPDSSVSLQELHRLESELCLDVQKLSQRRAVFAGATVTELDRAEPSTMDYLDQIYREVVEPLLSEGPEEPRRTVQHDRPGVAFIRGTRDATVSLHDCSLRGPPMKQATEALSQWRWEEGLREWVMRSPEATYDSKHHVTLDGVRGSTTAQLGPHRKSSTRLRNAMNMDAREAEDYARTGRWLAAEPKGKAEATGATTSLPQHETAQIGRSPSTPTNEGRCFYDKHINVFRTDEQQVKSDETIATCFQESMRPQRSRVQDCGCEYSPSPCRTQPGRPDSPGEEYQTGTLLSAHKAKRLGKLRQPNQNQ